MMTRWLLGLAILAGASRVVEAGHHCHETSPVIGYQTCGRFGGWSYPISMWWELGAVALRLVPTEDIGAVRAAGMRQRFGATFGAYYFGGEFDLAAITDGPGPGAVARDASMMTIARDNTFLVQNKFVIGRHARFGALMFGAELAPGARIGKYDATTFSAFMFEAHVKADVWLSPNFTIGADAGVDLVDTRDVTFAVTLGGHLMPYDRTR